VVRTLVETVEQATEDSRARAHDALQLLGRLGDPDAAEALREAAVHASAAVRGSAVQSLGWSGSRSDVPLIASRLGDAEIFVRTRARAALAELGGRAAADALLASLSGLSDLECGDAQAALAWLGDRRDLESIRALARGRLSMPYYEGRELSDRGWGSVYALFREGPEQDRRAFLEQALRMAREAVVDDPDRPWVELALGVKENIGAVFGELGWAGFIEEADRARAELAEQTAALRPTVARHITQQRMSAVRCEPLLARSVPRRAMVRLQSEPTEDAEYPAAKFGGQPDWVGEPTWPLGPGDWPMIFYGQLPLLGSPTRVAYIFFSVEVDDTWTALSQGNAVVVQPGSAPQVPTAARSTGPQLFHSVSEPGRYRSLVRNRPYERFVLLERGADPPRWSWPELPEHSYVADAHEDWRKIGGTPIFLQGEQFPAGEGWEFAFQFSADWAGHEFGDGAECYGFVTRDGGGAFLWQCH
jgi:hypothetical protein